VAIRGTIGVTGVLRDMTFGAHGEQHITVTVREDFREQFDALRDAEVEVTIKRHRRKRSLDANAYFHVLVTKIAEALRLGLDEVKRNLVCEYGTVQCDDDGLKIGFKLPVSVNVSLIYPYTKCFDTRIENGKEFNCYIVYKRTRELDSAEMARLIDGTINEARVLGLETDTPEQVEKYKKAWGWNV
jgi:hypothetical protein